jgi:hypothetical protein
MDERPAQHITRAPMSSADASPPPSGGAARFCVPPLHVRKAHVPVDRAFARWERGKPAADALADFLPVTYDGPVPRGWLIAGAVAHGDSAALAQLLPDAGGAPGAPGASPPSPATCARCAAFVCLLNWGVAAPPALRPRGASLAGVARALVASPARPSREPAGAGARDARWAALLGQAPADEVVGACRAARRWASGATCPAFIDACWERLGAEAAVDVVQLAALGVPGAGCRALGRPELECFAWAVAAAPDAEARRAAIRAFAAPPGGKRYRLAGHGAVAVLADAARAAGVKDAEVAAVFKALYRTYAPYAADAMRWTRDLDRPAPEMRTFVALALQRGVATGAVQCDVLEDLMRRVRTGEDAEIAAGPGTLKRLAQIYRAFVQCPSQEGRRAALGAPSWAAGALVFGETQR